MIYLHITQKSYMRQGPCLTLGEEAIKFTSSEAAKEAGNLLRVGLDQILCIPKKHLYSSTLPAYKKVEGYQNIRNEIMVVRGDVEVISENALKITGGTEKFVFPMKEAPKDRKVLLLHYEDWWESAEFKEGWKNRVGEEIINPIGWRENTPGYL